MKPKHVFLKNVQPVSYFHCTNIIQVFLEDLKHFYLRFKFSFPRFVFNLGFNRLLKCPHLILLRAYFGVNRYLFMFLKMNVLHQLVLLSHTNNCSETQQGGGGRESILHLNLQGYKKSWEAFHAFALGKGIVI